MIVFLRIIAGVLMIVPVVMMYIGAKRFRTQPGDKLGLAIVAGGDFLLFVLGWIASGYFLYPLMVCLVLVSFYCRTLVRSGIAGAHAVASVAAVAAVCVALLSVSVQAAGCGTEDIQKTVQELSRIAHDTNAEMIGEVLGESLAKRQVLVIMVGRRKGEIKGFRRGVASRFDIVHIARELPPKSAESRPSKNMAMRFDELLDARDDYDLVICFTELPYFPGDMEFWKRPEKERPEFVFVQGSGASKVGLLEKGWLTGILVTDQLGVHSYVHKDNLQAMRQAHPRMFPAAPPD